MERQHIVLFLSGILLSASLGGAVGSGLTHYFLSQVASEASVENVTFESFNYTEAWNLAHESVVSVVALKELNRRFGVNGLSEVSSGTAFFVSDDGLLLTNKHVVSDENADYVIVLSDGTEYRAQVEDRDSLNDIAILKIADESFIDGSVPFLSLSDSDSLQIGESVLAIGNALGEYANTTTAGIISGTDRGIVASSGFGQESLVGLIQTDAAINPGNSGGPLVDLEGNVVGMNTAISATAEGIGFAIPSRDLKLVLDSYLEHGEIRRAFLGVRFVSVTPGLVQRLKLKHNYGAILYSDSRFGQAVVPGSPAEKAGLQALDVILGIDGKEINNTYTIGNALAGFSEGDEVVIRFIRDGVEADVLVELGGN